MERKWKLVNSENVAPYVCDEVYSSKQLTGDEMAGSPVINVNEGTLKAFSKTGGGVHEETEMYYVVKCGPGAYVCLDEDRLPVKEGDLIVIPGGVFHWIDNTACAEPFVLFTFWPKQEQNGVYFLRKRDWGTTVRDLEADYTERRLGGEGK